MQEIEIICAKRANLTNLDLTHRIKYQTSRQQLDVPHFDGDPWNATLWGSRFVFPIGWIFRRPNTFAFVVDSEIEAYWAWLVSLSIAKCVIFSSFSRINKRECLNGGAWIGSNGLFIMKNGHKCQQYEYWCDTRDRARQQYFWVVCDPLLVLIHIGKNDWNVDVRAKCKLHPFPMIQCLSRLRCKLGLHPNLPDCEFERKFSSFNCINCIHIPDMPLAALTLQGHITFHQEFCHYSIANYCRPHFAPFSRRFLSNGVKGVSLM